MSDNNLHEDEHWLVRPQTIKLFWRVGLVILALTVVIPLAYEPHPYFGFDGWFAFNAVVGLLCCVASVFLAKFFGVFLRRPDDYYEGDE